MQSEDFLDSGEVFRVSDRVSCASQPLTLKKNVAANLVIVARQPILSNQSFQQVDALKFPAHPLNRRYAFRSPVFLRTFREMVSNRFSRAGGHHALRFQVGKESLQLVESSGGLDFQ